MSNDNDKWQQLAERAVSNDNKWQQLAASLRSDIAEHKMMRDAQVDGDDLHAEYQAVITFMTRQLLAVETNFDQLRAAQAAVVRTRWRVEDCHEKYRVFGARCGTGRNIVGGVGALAVVLWIVLGDVPGFVILVAVLGLLAAAGLHTLGVMGGGGLAATAEHAETELRAREAELEYLEAQVMQGVRNPEPLPANYRPGSQRPPTPTQSTGLSLFPEQPGGTQSSSSGQSAAQPTA